MEIQLIAPGHEPPQAKASGSTPDQPERKTHVEYTKLGNVGVLHISGIMYYEYYPEIYNKARAAVEDAGITALILSWNTPGGDVPGLHNLADRLFELRQQKRIISYVNTQCMSAGVWAAAGASGGEIYASSPTDEVGSIGAMFQHMDVSSRNAALGLKITDITAGKYKGITTSNRPLTEEGEKIIQAKVGGIYEIFLTSLEKFFGYSRESILTMAEGQVFLARTAQAVGLVQGILRIEELLQKLEGESLTNTTGVGTAPTSRGVVAMDEKSEPVTREEFNEMKSGMDEIKSMIRSMTEKSMDKSMDDKAMDEDKDDMKAEEHGEDEKKPMAQEDMAKALADDRKRIAGIQKLNQPGIENIVAQAIEDGSSIAETKAMIFDAMQAKTTTSPNIQLSSYQAFAGDVPAPAPVATSNQVTAIEDREKLIQAIADGGNAQMTALAKSKDQ